MKLSPKDFAPIFSSFSVALTKPKWTLHFCQTFYITLLLELLLIQFFIMLKRNQPGVSMATIGEVTRRTSSITKDLYQNTNYRTLKHLLLCTGVTTITLPCQGTFFILSLDCQTLCLE